MTLWESLTYLVLFIAFIIFLPKLLYEFLLFCLRLAVDPLTQLRRGQNLLHLDLLAYHLHHCYPLDTEMSSVTAL